MRNVLFGSSADSSGTASPDIVTYLIARFAALVPRISLTTHDVASLARQISLLLVGCIILSSVRAVLWQVGRLIKSSSRTRGAAFMLLLLAQLMVRRYQGKFLSWLTMTLRGHIFSRHSFNSVHPFHREGWKTIPIYLFHFQSISYSAHYSTDHFWLQPP